MKLEKEARDALIGTFSQEILDKIEDSQTLVKALNQLLTGPTPPTIRFWTSTNFDPGINTIDIDFKYNLPLGQGGDMIIIALAHEVGHALLYPTPYDISSAGSHPRFRNSALRVGLYWDERNPRHNQRLSDQTYRRFPAPHTGPLPWAGLQ